MEKTDFANYENLPEGPALFFVMKNDDCLYVGITCDFKNRFSNHHKFSDFVRLKATHICYKKYAKTDAYKMERQAYLEMTTRAANKTTLLNCRRSEWLFRGRNVVSALYRYDDSKINSVYCIVRDLFLEYLHLFETSKEACDEINRITGISVSWLKLFQNSAVPIDSKLSTMEKLFSFFTGRSILEKSSTEIK